jgi:4-amino-4-deoxy-L-arabinose transferase-like glycosyltransferase
MGLSGCVPAGLGASPRLAGRPGTGRASFDEGDYALYTIGAQHLAEVGDFSNSLFLIRPPLFVLQVFALGRNDLAILLVNAMLSALIAPAAVWLARRFGLTHGAAALAGVLTALDWASIRYGVFLGPEALANLLLAIGVAAFLRGVQPSRKSLGWALLGGLALGLSSLTRPATYLLWLPLLVWQVAAQRHDWRRLLVPLVGFALAAVIPTSIWAWHNTQVFSNPVLSTISPYTMLYYRAASIENLAGNYASMEDVYLELNRRVEAQMGRDPALATRDSRHGYLAASPELRAAINRVSLQIFLDHPLLYVATIPVGFARMMGLIPSSIRHVGDVLQSLWNVTFLLLTGLGLLRAALYRQWTLLFGVGLVMAYFVGGTLLVKSAGMTTRERTMLTPFMAAASAYALLGLGAWLGRRRRTARQPTNEETP